MKIKSSPILGTIGLLYGIFAGSVMGFVIATDQSKEKVEITTENIVSDPITAEVVVVIPERKVIEPAISQEVQKKIPSDLTKRCPEWEDELRQRGFPVELFSYIMWRESRCMPNAHNTTLNRDKSQDLGLLQINSTWKTVTRNICGTGIKGLFNPDCNLKVAKYLYENGGAGHWSM